jgi:hypothetical protein
LWKLLLFLQTNADEGETSMIHSTDCTVHTVGGGTLSFVLVLLLQALVRMRFLDARSARLESREVDGICLHQQLGNSTDVSDQTINHVQ